MGTTDPRLALASLDGMKEAGIGFALLHGCQRLLRGDVSDVDVVVGEDPRVVVRRTAASWASRGMMPVVVWPYDIGGTATVFLATPDASEGVQLDLLHDPDGVGGYRVKSPVLLATAHSSGALPMVSSTASLIYQWQKRTAKREIARLVELTGLAGSIDRDALLSMSEAITGSSDAARQMLEGRPAFRAQRLNRPAQRGIRLARRLMKPIGFWAHTAGATVGTELARRFARFLVCARAQPTPSPLRQPVWWATTIMPLRLRPGLFVSTGQPPRWRTPDVVLSASSADGAARQLTAAMTARFETPGRPPSLLNLDVDRGPCE